MLLPELPMYSIIWRYKIKAEYKEAFEKNYGPEGVWNALFRKSGDYRGTSLHQSASEPLKYLLIDHWKDKKSHEDFLRANRERYTRQSAALEYLYDEEERLGTYHTVG